MAAEAIKALKINRRTVKGSLTRFETHLNQIDVNNPNIAELKSRVAKLEPLWTKFDDIQSQIESLDESETPEDAFEEREAFETCFHTLMAKAEDILQRNSREVSLDLPPSNASSLPSRSQLRLPEINLPRFSGAYEDWYNFYNAFNSLIHSNINLTNIQKLQYLTSALRGEAAEIISCVEISDSNYSCVWDMLNERYDNKRLIISKHIQYILDLPSLNKENFSVLRQILDGLIKHVRILKSLDRPVDYWDDILIHIITNKLDFLTIKEWESTLKKNVIPTLNELIDFLSHKCNILETISRKQQCASVPNNKAQYVANKYPHKQVKAVHLSTNKVSCSFCDQDHNIYQCDELLKLSIIDRIANSRAKKLCLNCLRKGHSAYRCNSGRCQKCHKRHNTLLHLENLEKSSSSESVPLVSLHSHTSQVTSEVLLCTAIVDIRDSSGHFQRCRALLDSGSQSCFITESCQNRLKLPIESVNIPIVGISQANSQISSRTKVVIKSRFNAYNVNLNCLILKRITECLPLNSFSVSEVSIPRNIKLADPTFNTSGEIDLLIGAEFFWDLLSVGQIKLNKGQIILQKTQLGWIFCGQLLARNAPNSSVLCNLSITNEHLNDKLSTFWELEESSGQITRSPHEQYCESHFMQTFRRNSNGRFIVKLPLKDDSVINLGNSEQQAIKRFYSLERKLLKNPKLKVEYSAFLREYLQLGHMKLVDNSSKISVLNPVYYLPHHAVVKNTSLTTKVRVVFDGSAKTTSGLSLNDVQMVGPVLQQDLFSILTRFRTHRYVITADIAKMYRQVLIDPQQTKLQRIVWRENPSDDLKTYELLTVTYGTASASYLAIRSLNQLAIEEATNHPIGSQVALRDFYVDDLLTGASTIAEVQKIQCELNTMLLKGGFELRKWVSNCPQALKNISAINNFSVINLDKDESIGTLGLQWNSHDDVLKFSCPQYESTKRITKRIILSKIAQIFDPLGLIGPVILTAKLVMQQLWQSKISWDESIPISIHSEWQRFEDQLIHLNSFSLPRRLIGCDLPSEFQLHGFSDASERAYGACIYLRVTNIKGINTTALLCSKSRVAPLKNISLPKLELSGALLLAKLMTKVTKIIGLPINKTYYWTDSTITIAWIKSTARSWKTFVANRVGEIQDLTNSTDWFHVPTNDNPADTISRGSYLKNLINCKQWWTGPAWLSTSFNHLLCTTEISDDVDVPERRTATKHIFASVYNYDLFSKYSNFMKLIRITAYCIRFLRNTLSKSKRSSDCIIRTGFLSTSEIRGATLNLIKIVQQTAFPNELKDLRAGAQVNTKSQLVCLNPFLDENGIVRVGGRLRQASIMYIQKYPILLPKKHKFTTLLIEYEHRRHLHCGMQGTLAAVRMSYWPIGARGLIRDIVRKCIVCYKVKPTSLNTPIMGNLPVSRVTPSRPFQSCGIDYFGPLHIREGKRRNSKLVKAYGAIFVCLSTKAVHLELATDLSTETFLAAMKRFMSRRGKPTAVYSDNGTNFVGAKKELHELHQILNSESSKNKITSTMAENSVDWHFIPPRAPHFGGIWEAAVKSAKHHLRRVVGTANLNYEDMNTFLCQVEAVLNSRPLVPMSSDPNDLSFLTPGHFLIGDAITSIPEPNVFHIQMNRLSRWQYIERLRQHFWKRWSKEYLAQLQERRRWKTRAPSCVSPGQLVLIKDDNIPPLQWKLGRVDAIHPGDDGVVRAATIRTSSGSLKRATVKLCPLPIDNEC